ncbi:MAG TPA: aldehyde dehydrogenase family protein, partial [Gemmatimonadales bacterium]
MAIATINPATGRTLRTFEPLTAEQLEARLQCAADAYQRHCRTTFAERTWLMMKAAEILDSEKEALGRLMVTEMGKPLRAAMDEAAKSAWGCRYYAEHAQRFLADEEVNTTASRSYVTWQPIGPVLAIMPWNFPFWQVFRFAAPALMAGNVGLLKHASNVPQCALAIEDIFRRAGFPEGVFQTLLIETAQVPAVIEDPRVAELRDLAADRPGA